MCMATAAKKNSVTINVAYFSFLESTSNVAGPSYAEDNWIVTNSTIAVIASQRVMVHELNGGKDKIYSSHKRY
jgi:hypothetical protein